MNNLILSYRDEDTQIAVYSSGELFIVEENFFDEVYEFNKKIAFADYFDAMHYYNNQLQGH